MTSDMRTHAHSRVTLPGPAVVPVLHSLYKHARRPLIGHAAPSFHRRIMSETTGLRREPNRRCASHAPKRESRIDTQRASRRNQRGSPRPDGVPARTPRFSQPLNGLHVRHSSDRSGALSPFTCEMTKILQFRQRGPIPKQSHTNLTADRLRELARTGAEVTLNRLRAEIIAIERTFPELQLPQRRRAVRRTVRDVSKRTRKMSAEARNAVSARMKRYWAERRKAQAKLK